MLKQALPSAVLLRLTLIAGKLYRMYSYANNILLKRLVLKIILRKCSSGSGTCV